MPDEHRQRILRAAETRASIHHPNLLPARLVRGDGEQPVRLVLEERSGPRLDEVLASGRLTGRDCLRILYGVACGADALTQHGLVAGNITPSRIIVDAKRGGILAVKGMPAGLGGRPSHDPDAEAVYRSPEERDGQPVDARSDVYSLGVILSTALTGAPPTGLHDASSAIDAVIAWATDPEPARRYPGALEFVVAAEAAFEPAKAAPSAKSAPARNTRRERSSKARPAPPPPRDESADRPAPARRRSDRPGRRPRMLTGAGAGMAVAVLVFAVSGVLLGRTAGGETQHSRIGSPALTLRLAPGWVKTKVVGDARKLLSDPVAAAPADEDGVGIVAGRVRNAVVAARLLSDWGGDRPAGTRLGRLETWRYTGLRPKPNLVATGYLAPTTGDPLVVICHAPLRDGRARLPECERMASTIALRGASGVPLATIEGREKRFQRVMTALRRDRRAARRRLARARLASQQADAARRLESIYRRAARDLADTTSGPVPPAQEELTRSLGTTADAYGELSRAAAAVDRSRYRTATEVVRESEAAVLREAAEPRLA